MPYTNTAFSQAIFTMFDNLDFWLRENYHDLPNNVVRVYLFGGCAVHLHTGTRTSNDVDAEIQTIKMLKPLNVLQTAIKSVDFDDENGFPHSLDWDSGFNLSFASVDPAYEERAILIHTTESRLISVYLSLAVDLAVSKLGRLESVDRSDIQNLYQQGLFTKQEFIEIARQAKEYYAVAVSKLEFNTSLAVELF